MNCRTEKTHPGASFTRAEEIEGQGGGSGGEKPALEGTGSKGTAYPLTGVERSPKAERATPPRRSALTKGPLLPTPLPPGGCERLSRLRQCC